MQGMLFAAVALCSMATARAGQELPKGLVLNLDFRNIREGLIPSNTLYPLHVPQGNLRTRDIDKRTFLLFEDGQGLDIPHCTLLDPDGSTTWVASIRVLPLSDGIIAAQCNADSGFVIYLRDGVVHAAIQSGRNVVTLREQPGQGLGSILKKQVTIDLKISPNSAQLILNRNRVCNIALSKPLAGTNQKIRIGQPNTSLLPALRPNAVPKGFTGGIASFKILRQ